MYIFFLKMGGHILPILERIILRLIGWVSWFVPCRSVSVHCYGKVELLNLDKTKSSMEELVKKYEPSLLNNTEVLSPELTDKLMQSIVGFRIVIDEIQAKEKLGQHRSSGDQRGVYQSLFESNSAEAKMLATYMKKRNLGIGDELL
ncbi:MAG: hypothetical protein CENE_02819 [Candidatus Celerinatantimonas neptuna]|nr:MAG: hypothetical protein CENE_02819 [Candidatus Celerinatantimonas neptuna]